ncbi:hypothetical protein HQ533_05035 [Candidatus Woesearchaeota archaeon]|nr:hypothetical protein [Candidatus Woesearchaeota archaeon]
MKKGYILGWSHSNSPLLWVETIYVGDTDKMFEYFGFKYDNHYFTSRNQKVTFYKHIKTEMKAIKYGAIKYKDHKFIKFFWKKSKEIEKRINKATKNILDMDLTKKSNKEILELFEEFFDSYSAIMGIYRFCRGDFYKKTIEDIQKGLPEPKEENMARLLNNDFSRMKVDPKIKQILIGMKKVGDRRFEMHKTWQKAYTEGKVLLKEIGRRFGLTTLEIENCISKEIIEMLKRKKGPNKKKIQNRLKKYKLTYLKEGYEVTIPKGKIENFEDSQNIIKGRTACHEKVKGKVTILRESLSGTLKEDIKKMPEGNILVTEMTAPDMILAMKKASAIVTDVGGLLCHAAIVSRELKKPCIIGTKVATKVLKDGDFVEVDANKGVVKKIK